MSLDDPNIYVLITPEGELQLRLRTTDADASVLLECATIEDEFAPHE